MDKRGDLTSKQLVGLIILIVGFAIVLLFFWQINWTETASREACHQSVILKATAPQSTITKFILDLKGLIQLKCKTKKICITDSSNFFVKADCEEFAGEKYDTIRVSKDPEKQDEEINMIIAREMAECWGMMGEGKLNIFPKELTGKSMTKKCIICTRIAFDKDLKEEKQHIEKLAEYLINHKVPNKEITYWDYLTSSLGYEGYIPEWDEFSTEEKAIVFMEIDRTALPSFLTTILGGSGGGIIGAKIGASIGSIVPGGGTVVGGVVGFVGGAIIGSYAGSELGGGVESQIAKKLGEEGYAASNFFMDYEAAKLQGLDCDSFEEIP